MAKRYDRLATAAVQPVPGAPSGGTFRRHEGEQWEPEFALRHRAVGHPSRTTGLLRPSSAAVFREPAARLACRASTTWRSSSSPRRNSRPATRGRDREVHRGRREQGFSVELIEREDFRSRRGVRRAAHPRDHGREPLHLPLSARRVAAEGWWSSTTPTASALHQQGLPRGIARQAPPAIAQDGDLRRAERLARGRAHRLPCVVKQPDGSFSNRRQEVRDARGLREGYPGALRAVGTGAAAQEFVPTPYDWRVGVLDGEPLYVCKYHMRGPLADHQARRRWRARSISAVETFPVGEAPEQVVQPRQGRPRDRRGPLRRGHREVRGRPMVIEINDNPNIDHGYEDRVLGDELYPAIISYFTSPARSTAIDQH